jgi:aldehyde:ferredoxin oxidoreductase
MRRNIIRIDISSSTIKVEENSGAYNNLGGRGLTSAIVKQEVPPLCHPLGAGNKLIIAPGLLSKGHRGQTYTIDKCNFVFNFVILGTLRKRRLKPA